MFVRTIAPPRKNKLTLTKYHNKYKQEFYFRYLTYLTVSGFLTFYGKARPEMHKGPEQLVLFRSMSQLKTHPATNVRAEFRLGQALF